MIRSPLSPRRASLAAGALSGLAALVCFGAAHAVIIVPIWDQLLGGVPSVLAAGTAAGWAFAELARPGGGAAAAAPWGAMAGGMRLGLFLWLALLPMTAADVALRQLGVHQRFELVAVVVAVALALAAGAGVGHLFGRSRRAATAGALATLALTVAVGGPQPVLRSARAGAIFGAVLPVCVVSGALLGLAAWRLAHACARYRGGVPAAPTTHAA